MGAQYGDLRGLFNTQIALLKQIQRNTNCATCATVTPSVGTDTSIPAGANYVRVTKTNATGTVTISFPDLSTISLTADSDVFEIPLVGKLPAITISSGDGGTWTWLTLTK